MSMSTFDLFARPQTGSGGRSRGVEPTIRINKPGLVSLNRPAAELFAEAAVWLHVYLLSDTRTGQIALAATTEHDPNGWKARPKAGGGIDINAKAFIVHLGVEVGTRYLARRHGDFIIGDPA